MKIHSIEVYKSKSGGFRWRAKARNGKVVAAATEDFRRYRSVLANVLASAPGIGWMPAAWKWGAKRAVVSRGNAVWS